MNIKILIVEDDIEVVKTLLLIFEHFWPDAKVVYTHFGEPGIEMVKTEEPDVVVLDLGLPDVPGIEVMHRIRLFSSIPIIVLTAHTAEDEIVEALEDDATDYVIKPFKHRELLARIQSHVTRWKTNEIRAFLQNNMDPDKD
jgi:DNA-binding response OmpR family regulator